MSDLVFDVGMHNGDDSAYYLAMGYDVVAVEANVVLCDAARERFAAEIAAGRLTVRNVGIAESVGALEFWVSDVTEWSSFHEENATQAGTRARPLRVATVAFDDLLDEYRPPLYVKVDIERNDALCIRDIARRNLKPRYFSFEGHTEAARDIDLLAQAGYAYFKCIRQIDWREITPENMGRQAMLRKALSHTSRVPRVGGRLVRRHYRPQTVNGWQFAPGSSGPLGRDLPGRWISRDEVQRVWEHRLKIDREMDARGLGEWFDIHATTAP